VPEPPTLTVAELGLVDYSRALELQNALVAARLADQIGDALLLLEHQHVFTLGRGADQRFIRDSAAGIPAIRVSRGGQVTYHGPGQLVGYPILKLEDGDRDVARYLRRLEQAMIEALARCGVEASRRERLTGVWVGAEKIASIGVGIRRWVACHGFALNITCDLRFFDSIVPCGIEGCRMTSLKKLGCQVRLDEFSTFQAEAFATVFGYQRIQRVDPALLWQRVASAVSSAEAHLP